METYRLDTRTVREVVFCDPIPVAGAAGGAPGEAGTDGEGGATIGEYESLRCTLWTGGPADVTLSAAGYPPIERALRRRDGLCTVDEAMQLLRGDGGL